jgi:hypothetical protein
MSVPILKASGKHEAFKIQKLVNSLIRSGASEALAWDIARKVEKQIAPNAHTKQIFKMAKRMLRKHNRTSDMKYSIKKALYSLGPAGYQFEKYFARILKAYGYCVETNQFIHGHCVKHEVDIFARKNNNGSIIECKYHSKGGIATDVKTALYIHSRFTDIRRAYNLMTSNNVRIKKGWLVTNTRCTSDAIQYAQCVGMKIVSWKYPEDESLEKLIENKRLYPVTILSSVRKGILKTLFSRNFILAKDISKMNEDAFLKRSRIDKRVARNLKREADEICSNP